MTTTDVALSARGLVKRYGGVTALGGVDIDVRAGQVTALLGENGAGKSTFVACCSGARTPDEGTLVLDGEPVSFSDPHSATVAGVAVVHQEPQMLDDQTVAQNLNLAALAQGARRALSRGKLEALAREQLGRLGLHEVLDPATPVRRLSGAHRQLVEITRALMAQPRVLFLDEPNASLGDEETELLFAVVRRLRDRGVAVVLISHRLTEVYRIADRIVVMRDGKKVADGTAEEIGIDVAVQFMGGRPRDDRPAVTASTAAPSDRPVLELKQYTGDGFTGVDLQIRPGEILGMAGLVGSGRSEIALGVIGASPAKSGQMLIDGRRQNPTSPGAAMRCGLVYVAEDRKDAVFYDKSISFNMRASMLGPRRAGQKRLTARAEQALVDSLFTRLKVKAPGVAVPAASLSGGNQQKLLFGRAVSVQPRLLILDEPTHGVDIGTRQEIHELIRALAADGLAVWVISSELDEILDLATRIVVVREGRIAAEVPAGHDPLPVLAAALGAGSTAQEATRVND